MSEKSNLYQRMLAVTRDVGAIGKGRTAPAAAGGYSYQGIDDITDALRGHLVANGLVVSASVKEFAVDRYETTTRNGPRMVFAARTTLEVTVINADNPEERLTIQTQGMGIEGTDKVPGIAYSYALKTALLALFHLRGQPDAEGTHTEIEPRHRESDVTPNFQDPPAGRANTGMDTPATPNQVKRLQALRDDPRVAEMSDSKGVSVRGKLVALLADDGPTKAEASTAIDWISAQLAKGVAA